MNAIIIRTQDAIAFTGEAQAQKQKALIKASLIESVTTADDQKIAVAIQQEIKGILSDVEKSRKEIKQPLLEAGVKIDDVAKQFRKELEEALKTVSDAITEFQIQEQERVQAAERARAEELNRIERERQEALREEECKRQAELARIEAEKRAELQRQERERQEALRLERERQAREQAELYNSPAEVAKRAEADRIAKEQAEAAKRKADEELAAAKERMQAELDRQRNIQDLLAKQQQEALGDAPTAIRAAGQVVKHDWEISIINQFQAVKARPDLVRKVEFDTLQIKAELNEGKTIPGIFGKKVLTTTTRKVKQQTLDV